MNDPFNQNREMKRRVMGKKENKHKESLLQHDRNNNDSDAESQFGMFQCSMAQ